MEHWKPSSSMRGYEVSNYGNVRHLKRRSNLSASDNGRGYLVVTRKENNKRINYYVHRLVAEVFCSNINEYMEVNHIDCNKHNNNACNLEWCTRRQNVRHAIQNNRVVYTEERLKRLEENRQTACQANRKPVMAMIDGKWVHYESKTDAGKSLGVSITTISRAISGRVNSCRGTKVRYA
jgi:hypothetical protein